MDMEVAARVLAGSILTMLSFIVVVIGIIVTNNIIHKYWKPIRIFTSDSWNINPPSAEYNTEFTEPRMDSKKL